MPRGNLRLRQLHTGSCRQAAFPAYLSRVRPKVNLDILQAVAGAALSAAVALQAFPALADLNKCVLPSVVLLHSLQAHAECV